MNLNGMKKFRARGSYPCSYPSTIDANENYLVVGYKLDKQASDRDRYVYVDVHSRKELNNYGYQLRIVSYFLNELNSDACHRSTSTMTLCPMLLSKMMWSFRVELIAKSRPGRFRTMSSSTKSTTAEEFATL